MFQAILPLKLEDNDPTDPEQKSEFEMAESETEDSGYHGPNSTDSSSIKVKYETLQLTNSINEIAQLSDEELMHKVNELGDKKLPAIHQLTSRSCSSIASRKKSFHRTLSQPVIDFRNEKCKNTSATRTQPEKNAVLLQKKEAMKINSRSLPTLIESSINNVPKNYKTTSVKLKILPPINGENVSGKMSVRSTLSLPRLKINEARKRNFLIGNLESNGALLGSKELERHFPNRKMSLFVGTWNVHRKCTTESLNDFLLPTELEFVPDLYAIGIEEGAFPNKQEWELKLQETIGLSHVILSSAALGALHLCVLIRRELIWFCSVVDESNIKLNASINTKGAVALQFLLFGTSFLFLCSHLTAHTEKLSERIQDYKKIVANLNLPDNILGSRKHRKEVFDKYDCVFWIGDLNFRLNQKRETVMSQLDFIKQQPNPNYDDLLWDDQLIKSMSGGDAFKGFNEGRINFMPTYKYNAGTNDFDTSEKLRTPSYTDRILYRNRRKNTISCIFYNSVETICSSDHKPVYAFFEVNLRPGRDNIPLAAGNFRRDIYLNAIKMRTEDTDFTESTTISSNTNSAVCSVM